MGMVKEHLAWWPKIDDVTTLERDEALILQGPRQVSMRPMPAATAPAGAPTGGPPGAPTSGGGPRGAGGLPAGEERPGGGSPGGRERPPREQIEVVHVPVAYEPKSFSPPLWVYENEDVRVEHQDMNGRQPFYHRNTEVDELSYQVVGPRQLITEIGSVDLEAGDFVNIPVGVAHDNWGRQEIHLLFYVKAPLHRQQEPVRFSKPHEFTAWEPTVVPEMISARGGGICISSDERVLLAHANSDDRQLEVVHIGSSTQELSGSQWVYKSQDVWIGSATLQGAEGTEYQRKLNVDELQFQLEGKRTLITDLGCVELEPGDFVRIPAGVAHTSVTSSSSYLTLYSAKPLKRLVDPVRTGEVRSPEQIAALRSAAGLG